MTTPAQPRVHRGVPAGGEFAAHLHSDSVPALGAPTVNEDFVAARLGQFGFAGHMSAEEITRVTAQLNASRDFRDENITAVADLVHRDTAGYTLTDMVSASEGLGHLTRLGHEDEAAALSRILDASPVGVSDEDADAIVEALECLESLERDGYDHSTARSANEKLRAVLERNDIGIATDPLGQLVRDRPLPALEADIFAVPRSEPVPDGKTVPVPHDDPRLQAGEVFDVVLAEDTVFVRSSIAGHPQDTQAIRFQANRPLTEAEAYALSGVVGYANSSAIGGEPLDNPAYGPSRDTPFSFIAHIDTNKGRQGNFEKFEDMIPDLIANGSKPRSTQGGTRAIEPFGDTDLKLEIYYAE